MNQATDDHGAHVRQLLLTASHATLCTLSTKKEVAGTPFGSIVPFALTDQGLPLILIASIAAHTKNLLADPRASLFVSQPDVDGDPQAGWRITLMGQLVPADQDNWEDHHARYLQRVPAAEGYLQTHGFSYFTMKNYDKIRFIGGFGKIYWLDGRHGQRKPDAFGLDKAAAGAVAHMNEDHKASMITMCQGFYGFTPDDVTMVSLDCAGFMVQAKSGESTRRCYFPFGKETNAERLRHDVVDVVKAARALAAV